MSKTNLGADVRFHDAQGVSQNAVVTRVYSDERIDLVAFNEAADRGENHEEVAFGDESTSTPHYRLTPA